MILNDLHYIKALGNLLVIYESDLNYILKFKDYKANKITKKEFLSKTKGSFQSFINNYKVARNIKKEKVPLFLHNLVDFIKHEDYNNVDALAIKMKTLGYTHGKIMTSLCSKVLFINNPYEIIPMDSLAKKSLNYNSNIYAEYKEKLDTFIKSNQNKMNEYLKTAENHISVIEKPYVNKIGNLNTIRKNRYIDILLWTKP